jgi:formamidopyrimidine-DNA glycosylase
MPELPEIETIASGLRRRALGLTIARIDLFLPKLLRGNPAALESFKGKTITDIRRRGKMLLISCGKGRHLLFHLKMTGGFEWVRKGKPGDAHARLRIVFRGSGRDLLFSDVRKFAFLRCLETEAPLECHELGQLGPEPLVCSAGDFAERLASRKGRLKSLLLDQRFLAGIGNIYADESLFEARLHPLAPASSLLARDVERLWAAIRGVLARAVAAGGSSIRNYRADDGAEGFFQNEHHVYGRAGQPCSRCGKQIRRMVIGGRSSHFCPRCQRPRRRRSEGAAFR